MTTDADKVRFLAELAGWEIRPGGIWLHSRADLAEFGPSRCDYPHSLDPHSLDAIARDLLPLLREKGWEYMLSWNGSFHRFMICKGSRLFGVAAGDDPARAAFEAIYEALHGGEE